MSDEWTQIDLNKGKNTEIASVPEIIEGKWKDTEGNEITSARINDTVVLYIKTKNFPDNALMNIVISEYDFGILNDDDFDNIPAIIKNNTLELKIKLIKYPYTISYVFKQDIFLLNLWMAENETQYLLYFKISAQIGSKTLEATFPKDKNNYLKVGYHKLSIAGNDADNASERASLMEAAGFQTKFNYIIHNQSIKTGREFIQALRNFKNKPIDSLFISAHGCPYAIDFQTSGSNLYISKANVTKIVRNVKGYESWTPKSDARYIKDIKSLVDDKVLSPTCEIIISACLCGSVPSIVTAIENDRADPNQFNLSWAELNKDKAIHENFAQQLSKQLPGAVIVTSKRRVDSGVGIAHGTLVIYLNGMPLGSSHKFYSHYDEIIGQYRKRKK